MNSVQTKESVEPMLANSSDFINSHVDSFFPITDQQEEVEEVINVISKVMKFIKSFKKYISPYRGQPIIAIVAAVIISSDIALFYYLYKYKNLEKGG